MAGVEDLKMTSLIQSAKFLFHDSAELKDETNDEGMSAYLLERRSFYNDDQWKLLNQQLSVSCTLYVGNLSFYTTEDQLYAFFSLIGNVKRIIMGLNKVTSTPCGFCFVEYFNHEDALNCQRHLSGRCVDERIIKCALDAGFEEGRQYGRSKLSGGQRRDDYRESFDQGRGGVNAQTMMLIRQQHLKQHSDIFRQHQHPAFNFKLPTIRFISSTTETPSKPNSASDAKTTTSTSSSSSSSSEGPSSDTQMTPSTDSTTLLATPSTSSTTSTSSSSVSAPSTSTSTPLLPFPTPNSVPIVPAMLQMLQMRQLFIHQQQLAFRQRLQQSAQNMQVTHSNVSHPSAASASSISATTTSGPAQALPYSAADQPPSSYNGQPDRYRRDRQRSRSRSRSPGERYRRHSRTYDRHRSRSRSRERSRRRSPSRSRSRGRHSSRQSRSRSRSRDHRRRRSRYDDEEDDEEDDQVNDRRRRKVYSTGINAADEDIQLNENGTDLQ